MLSSEEAVVFILSRPILQMILFSHWEIIHRVLVQNTRQIRVVNENDSEEIVCFSFKPVCCRENIRNRRDRRIFNR